MIEIVVLALLAGFIALRLISVLGNHDESAEPQAPVVPRAQARQADNVVSISGGDAAQAQPLTIPDDVNAAARAGLEDIHAADPDFDPVRFLSGATEAYRLVLEAFWRGDAEALKELVSDDIAEDFAGAIEAREADKLTYENRLVGVERAEIVSAVRRGEMAEVTVRFDADLVAVTRDAEGTLIAGSESDATQSHDIWTFSRHLRSDDPAWLLIETDSAD
ncbi:MULTISPECIES: Tim44/TimA family putative adaptor protein [Pacificimonas]|uniref:Tim44 domain-containing protein n=1 Tax=Pacificimonas aurantium TaxID=1250540 RepID=A0ABS7WJI8_9SPHN|nr:MULTISPECIES: Tim44/TimA family putative adaptor protein [Pacificimonas]MBZ6378110.1 Tim44 domain-containing protein [Pacificimonas aurantium]